MTNLGRTFLAIGFVAFLSTTAFAATKSIAINRGDLFRQDHAQFSSGITLSSGVTNSAIFSFQLPGDYKTNSPVTIRYYFLSDGFDCSLPIQVSGVRRSRLGFFSQEFTGAASGLSKAGSGSISSPSPFVPFKADFKLRPPTTGPFMNSQVAGDRLTVAIARVGVSDPCANSVTVEDVEIIYTTP